MAAHSKRTDRMRGAVLKALREGRGYGGAAAAVGMARRTFEMWRHDDPEFARLCEDAREDTVDRVEHRLFSDAMAGNTLAQLAYLRAYRPERFYRKMLVVGDPMNPVAVEHQHSIAPPDSEADEPVRFYLPHNGRDQPDPEDEPPTIEGEADDAAA